ncbi:MAG: hypothetical protein KF757_13015 [Phycisphaeraceae bacterium]|nr:hypothetical protein [Phycisphaeraceae bacterium]
MTAIVLISAALVLLTTALHLAYFSVVARRRSPHMRLGHLRFYALMIGLFAIHVMDIALYAVGFYIASDVLGLGDLRGEGAAGALGHFYTSAVIYTTLGFGDVLPSDHLRCLTATEALNGLLFIAWSTAFIFATMSRFWADHGNKESSDG